MNSIDKIINCLDSLTDEQVETICMELTNPTEETKKNLTDILGVQIYEIINNSSLIKYIEFIEYTKESNTINLTCIEDWKNKKKLI